MSGVRDAEGVVERSFYLDIGSEPAFATAHLPAGPGRSTAVLLVPPLGWDEQCSYRVRRQWANSLASAGYCALRFDLQGTGDSADCVAGVDLLPTWVDTVGAAATWLREASGCERVAALGIGFGGLLAWVAAATGAPLDDLVLWGMPPRGSRLIRQLHASATVLIDPRITSDSGSHADEPRGKDLTLEPGDLLDDGGQVLRKATVESISAVDVTKLPLAHATHRRVLLFERAGDERLRDHLAQTGADVTVRDGQDFERLMHYVQYSSLPASAAEDLLLWLEGGLGVAPAPDSTTFLPPTPTASQTVDLVHGGVPIRETALAMEVDGCILRGILTEPAGSTATELCGFFLTGGSDRRTGQNRFWVDVARRWAAVGVPSVRMDPMGVGDSGGDSRYLDTLRGQHRERVVDRTLAMLDAVRTLGVPERLFLVGSCSGSWRAVRAAAGNPSVVGVYALDLEFLRWSWWIVHLHESWISAREPGPDETAPKRLLLFLTKVLMRSARPVRRWLINSRTRSRRNLRTFARLRSQGTDVTLVYRQASEPLEELQGDITASAQGDWKVTLLRAPGFDSRYRPLPLQAYVHWTLDDSMRRVLKTVSSSSRTAQDDLNDGLPAQPVPSSDSRTAIV